MRFAVVRVLRFVALASIFLGASAHAEKKVYACKDAGGNAIFSPQPCGPDAKELHVDAGSSAPPQAPADPASQSQESSPAQADDPPYNPIADNAADAACRDEAVHAGVYPTDEQMRLLEMRRTSVINAIAHGDATDKQAADIEAAIEQERSRFAAAKQKADAAYRAALAECSKRKAERARARLDH